MDNKLQKKLKDIEVKLRDNMRELYYHHNGKYPTESQLDRIYDHYLQIQLDFDRMEKVIIEQSSELIMQEIIKNPKLTNLLDDLEDEHDEKIMDKFYSLYKEKK